MKLSNNNLVKQTTITSAKKPKAIVTKSVSLPHSSLLSVDEPEIDGQAYKVHKKSFETLKQKIIADAQNEGTKIKEAARQAGLKEGYDQGYQDGKEKGEQLAAVIEQQAKQNFENAGAEVKRYVNEKQNEVVSFAIEMAEVILQHKIDDKPAELLSLLEPILFKLEKPDQVITIRAHEKYHEVLTARMEKKKKETLNLRYLILDDQRLSPYEVTVESNESFETLALQEELHKFLLQFKKECL
ncbi:FliH/SctL family protein [Liquorilactobacillus oeni]|uniref:Flagellar assembly protein FliH n=2 Tax=Liquorilactobacillus oeni TaxID=303241 RepID=A0A0R1MCF8_9LACO|nr:FliH/SctL family protein [Liquorilactobacillus oeni]AJA34207.1 flagellar assembly protein FliH [Liquorilactobacillus oeni]KRL05513.1 flagellar assembly protein FliH [Liquorilactobacillus oeni DSM 19972]